MIPKNSADKAAPSGWMQRLVRCSSFASSVRLTNHRKETSTRIPDYNHQAHLMTPRALSRRHLGESASSLAKSARHLQLGLGHLVSHLYDLAILSYRGSGGQLVGGRRKGCSDVSSLESGGKSSSTNVKAHPPLGARASVERGVEGKVIINVGKQGGS